MPAAIGLLIVAILANLPAWTAGSWSGTEARRVEIVREMAASGDFVVPTLGLEPTLAKPPLFYWTLAAIARQFGDGQVAMRAASVLSLWFVAWLAFAILRRSHDDLVGWIAGLGILCSPALIHHGAFAEIDPMFAAFTASSILALGHAVGFQSRKSLVLAGLLGAAALLTKGPPYFLFLVGALAVWLRHSKLRGIVWFAVPLIVPALAFYLVLRNQPAALDLGTVAEEETLDRLFTYEWRHVLDIPLHFVRAGLIMLPFGLFVFAEHRGSHLARLQAGEMQQRFCSSAALGSVLLLALFPGHAVRYMLPTVVLCICGVAPAVCGFLRFPAALGPTPLALVRGLGVTGAIGLCVLPFLPYPMPGNSVWLAFAIALAPLVVTTRARFVAYALAIPVLAAWTALDDRRGRYERGVYSSDQVGALLVEEMTDRSVSDVATQGHITYSYLFGWPELLAGDEKVRREASSAWLLVEHVGTSQLRPAGYVDSVRIRGRNREVVLLQRVP